MALTVKRVAQVSGVSVRTLHFYDEIDLLKPAFVGANGYRYYEEAQLLTLQQILFFRELGIELKVIQRILKQSDFNRLKALKAHRKMLVEKQERTGRLLLTIDKTIALLNEGKTMKAKEIFAGFDVQKQAEHEEYLIKRFGESARKGIEESKRKVQNWTKDDWRRSGEAWTRICKNLVQLMERGRAADSAEVQSVVREHYGWLKHFWTPNKESYAGHGQFILETDLGKAYEAHHPGLAKFLAAAITTFAERELV